MNGRNSQFDELGQLTAALCDGQITPQQGARLEQLVNDSDSAWRYFCDYTQIHSELCSAHLSGGEALRSDDQVVQAEQVESQRPPCKHPAAGPRRPLSLLYAALAGSVLLALTVGIIQWYRAQIGSQVLQPLHVARLSGTVDAEWSDDGAPDEDGRVVAGRELVLRRGFAAVSFDGGARVILQAPAVFEPQSSTSGLISQGLLTARVPAEAVGFTVRTPTATVVDLGTEFGVAVEPSGLSEVEVFVGRVEVSVIDVRDALPTIHPVQGGESLRVAPSVAGGLPQVERLAAGTRQFVRALPDSVARLRALIAAETHLRHHYTFEGATVAERCRDKRGDLHLHEIAMHDGRDGGELEFPPAWLEATGRAFRPFRAAQQGNLRGVGLQSQAEFQPPKAMTVELLLRLDDVGEDQEGSLLAAVATRANRRSCGFLVTAVDHGELAHLLDGEAPWLRSGFDFVPGHWYYVASTFQTLGERETMVNSYVADLSMEKRTLQRVIKDRRTPGVPAAGPLGIGKGFDGNAAHAYPWSGALDEIAIYDAVLDSSVLQAHLEALTGG
jgi:hypothetical protein